MKKALMLAGLVLCSTAGFAAENRHDVVADGLAVRFFVAAATAPPTVQTPPAPASEKTE